MAAAFNATGRRVLAKITRNKEAHRPSSTNRILLLKGKVTQREMAEKIKYYSKTEISAVLIKIIFAQHPHLRIFLQYHTPTKTPCLPPADHPVFRQCFHCKTPEELYRFFGVRICGRCGHRPFSRDRNMEMFHVPRREADNIKRIASGRGALTHIYQPEDVVKAVKKKHGSLVKFCVQEKHGDWRLPSPALETYELRKAAIAAFEQDRVIGNALSIPIRRNSILFSRALLANI